jgi:hypothetical protein
MPAFFIAFLSTAAAAGKNIGRQDDFNVFLKNAERDDR